MYELPHKLLKDVRIIILRNWETSRKFQNFVHIKSRGQCYSENQKAAKNSQKAPKTPKTLRKQPKRSKKTEIELYPYCIYSQEIVSQKLSTKSQNLIKLRPSEQSSSKNDDLVDTSKNLRETEIKLFLYGAISQKSQNMSQINCP